MAGETNTKREAKVEREEGPSKGRYFVTLEGGAAEMTYSRAGETMIIIDRTDVPASLKGLGLGGVLVRRAVEDARKEGKKIVPLCPFAKAYFAKHPELQDVLS